MFGILRSGAWGFVKPKPDAPEWLGLSPVIWLIARRARSCCWVFLGWEHRRLAPRQASRWSTRRCCATRQLRGGLIAFFFQFLLQAGLFFVVPLFLSVALGLVRHRHRRAAPAAVGHAAARRRGRPEALPARLAATGRPRSGFLALFAGIVVAGRRRSSVGAGRRDRHRADAARRARASARSPRSSGAVTVSAVPDEQSGEVGGLQNTVTNLGASLGTALAGAVLIAALTTSFLTGIDDNPDVPPSVVRRRPRSSWPAACRSSPTPTSRAALDDAGVDPRDRRRASSTRTPRPRLDGLRSALAVLALLALVAFFTSGGMPTRQPGSPRAGARGGVGHRPRGQPIWRALMRHLPS